MEELVHKLARQYYTDLILIGILLTSTFVSIEKRKKFKILKYFPAYIISLLLLCVFYEICDLTSLSNYFLPILHYGDYFFTLLELIIFSHFYYQLINNKIFKKSILILNVLFSFFFIFMGLIDKEFYQSISESTQSKVYTIEGVILLLICSFYFFELFQKMPIVNLRNEPAFWISTGLLFFMVCTLPFSLLENYIENYYRQFSFVLYPIFYIFYILLFTTIIRAYLCKPVNSNSISDQI